MRPLVADGSVDVVIPNAANWSRKSRFSEIVRILRPGGRLHLADIALDIELSEDIRRNIDLWTG
jgi:hypothetical protein